MQPAGRFSIPVTHPSLAGHFPGHPVTPGVVLLEAALACLPPGLVLRHAKFTAPVPPGAVVEVSSAPAPAGGVVFACHVDGALVLRGTTTA